MATSPPPPTVAATPAAPAPQVIVVTQAPQPAVGVTGTGGCLAPDPNDAGVVDPTLLLAGLLLPAGILARWGISRRRR